MIARHTSRAALPVLSLLLGGSLVLTGCGGDSDVDPAEVGSPTQSTTEATAAGTNASTEVEAETSADASADAGQGDEGLSLPATFPTEVPLLSYELTDVVDREAAAEYRLTMRGTDLDADAEQLRAQMADAGFTEVVWLQTEATGVTSVFQRDGIQVGVKILDKESHVEIRYDVGRH